MHINGINYHVETFGSGKPLVLLHGFTGSGANWAAHVEVFARSYQVVTVDLLGHGQTDSPYDPDRYRIDLAAQDLVTLFDAFGYASVTLLGYSMGGRLALYTALSYPAQVERLILESASPGLKTAAERWERITQDEILAQRCEDEGIPAFADYWTKISLFATQSPEIRERLRQQRLQNNSIGLANSLRGMGTGVQPSLWQRLCEIDMPTLLLCGALDSKFRRINTEMCDLIPGALLSVIADAGHTTHVEQPGCFREEVLHFL